MIQSQPVRTIMSGSNKVPQKRRDLEVNQLRALDCLVSKAPGESMESVAKRAGISRVTLYKYLKDPKFDNEFRERVRAELKSSRSNMGKALLLGALTYGPGQSAMMKLYYEIIGDHKNQVELTGPDGGPIQVQGNPLPLEQLPGWAQQVLIVALSGGKVSEELERKIIEELGSSEQLLLGAGGNGDVIDITPEHEQVEVETESEQTNDDSWRRKISPMPWKT